MTFSGPALKKMPVWITTFGLAGLLGCSGTRDGMQEPMVVSAPDGAQNPDQIEFIPKGSSTEQIDAVASSVGQDPAQPAFVETEVGDEISHATTEEIPIEINADVERWLDFFTMKDRERFKRFLERGSRYKPMITAVLKEQGIPTELYYQAMIESGFAVHATSIASAVGIWQFIPSTGKRYGLRIDHYVDERRDPMRATIAAALYMRDLHNVFQNWYLAMAAYNAGEGRILGAIMRSNTRDFWEMVRKRSLPVETMNYIPKFIAATTIGHNLKRYGFEDITPDISPQLVGVNVPAPVKLTDIAKVSGIPHATLAEFNPHLRRGITPPGQPTYRLWVPKDMQDKLADKEKALAALRVRNAPVVAASSEGSSPVMHKVRRGEHLSSISKKYGVSIASLRKLNNLKSNKVYAGQNLRIAGTTASKTAAVRTVKSATTVKYRVKRGDNLDKIARKFNTSVPEIKRLNNMKRNSIMAGQVLTVNNKRG